MDNHTTDLILELYREKEISEYAARQLLDDETIDQLIANLKESRRMVGHQCGEDDEEGEWPDDVPLPYGHLPEEEYYGADPLATED